MRREFEVFTDFVRSKHLRHTPQRDEILAAFLRTERHVSVDELYKLVKRHNPDIGYTTVYRTMKLLSESGLCQEFDFGDGIARFEHKYGHEHHDHLICVKCGRFIEAVSQKIEKLQDSLTRKYAFTPTRHKLQIFGLCRGCLGK